MTYTYAGNQTLANGWNGAWTQSGKTVTVANVSYNGSLAAGATTSAGANFNYSGTNAAPDLGHLHPHRVHHSAARRLHHRDPGQPERHPGQDRHVHPRPVVGARLERHGRPRGQRQHRADGVPGQPDVHPVELLHRADRHGDRQLQRHRGHHLHRQRRRLHLRNVVTATEVAPMASSAPQLHVSGNKLVDANGNTVVLHGVDRSGTEYECVQGNGIFDGPNDQASITAIKSWGPVNAVRVPLNEACWNAESYVNSAYAGANYINAIKSYVSLLNSNGIVAILDLHWTDGTYTGPGQGSCTSSNQAEAFCQKPMPDAAQAVPFWTSVANTFKGNDAVIFDLFNEPFPEQADSTNETEGWQCWLNGGSSCVGISYTVAGMQTLVNAVRSAGANNVLMLGGLEWSNDLTQWLQHEPTDPDHNLAASWHSYNFNACSNQSCWTSQVAPVAASVPVVAGEIGENDCAGSYITPLTTWMESEGISFLAWAWNADFACSSGPGLITDYTGTPTAYGAAYKAAAPRAAPRLSGACRPPGGTAGPLVAAGQAA